MSLWGSFMLTGFCLGFWTAWRLLCAGRESSLLRLPEKEEFAFETLCGRAFIFSQQPFSWNLGIRFLW